MRNSSCDQASARARSASRAALSRKVGAFNARVRNAMSAAVSLPLREVIFTEVPEGQPKFSTFKAKWDDAYRKRWGIQNVFAEPFPDGVVQRMARICKAVYRALRIRGYGRIDLRVTPEGEIVILEANPNPQIASGEDFAQSAADAAMVTVATRWSSAVSSAGR